MNQIYEKKYLKYKQKYLNLKYKLKGSGPRQECYKKCIMPTEYVTFTSGPEVQSKWDEYRKCTNKCLVENPYTEEEKNMLKTHPGLKTDEETEARKSKRKECYKKCIRPEEHVTLTSGPEVQSKWDEYQKCFKKCLEENPYTEDEKSLPKTSNAPIPSEQKYFMSSLTSAVKPSEQKSKKHS